ncbi:UrcA family protein [Erythrobacter sp. R86502]|uniref:UrcA family protein n=1 Tax=Erythrobacter sp. R86502 TaxID=3093846 RepID=UPI0036D26096
MTPLATSFTRTLAALTLAGAAVTPALADNGQPMRVAVKTADIDLGTTAGQQTLDWRVDKAARTVCRVNSPATGTRVMRHDARGCMAKARSEARQQVAALAPRKQRGG